MGLVLDNNTIGFYEKWLLSPVGKAMDEFVRANIPIMLSPQKNDKILDIGCGTGNQLLSLSRFGFDLSGIDASPTMIEIAKSRLGNSCELKTGRAEDLPFSDNEFDDALLINTLEFVDDPLTVLKEAGRVARKKVLICVINSLSIRNMGVSIQGFFYETLTRHIRLYNLWEIKSYIKDAYGAVPVSWKCAPDWPRFKDRHKIFDLNSDRSFNCPFGPMLCISVTLNPLIRTESLPLKIVVKKAEQPFV